MVTPLEAPEQLLLPLDCLVGFRLDFGRADREPEWLALRRFLGGRRSCEQKEAGGPEKAEHRESCG
jgi:hypothetical protein